MSFHETFCPAVCSLAFQSTKVYTRVCSAFLYPLESSPVLYKISSTFNQLLDHIAHQAIVLDSQDSWIIFFSSTFFIVKSTLGQRIITVHLGQYLLIIFAKSKTYKIVFEYSSCWVERNCSEILKPTVPAISSIFHVQPLVIKDIKHKLIKAQGERRTIAF